MTPPCWQRILWMTLNLITSAHIWILTSKSIYVKEKFSDKTHCSKATATLISVLMGIARWFKAKHFECWHIFRAGSLLTRMPKFENQLARWHPWLQVPQLEVLIIFGTHNFNRLTRAQQTQSICMLIYSFFYLHYLYTHFVKIQVLDFRVIFKWQGVVRLFKFVTWIWPWILVSASRSCHRCCHYSSCSLI